MKESEIKKQIIGELEKADGELCLSDAEWCERLGLEKSEYVDIQHALVQLSDEGQIYFARDTGEPGEAGRSIVRLL